MQKMYWISKGTVVIPRIDTYGSDRNLAQARDASVLIHKGALSADPGTSSCSLRSLTTSAFVVAENSRWSSLVAFVRFMVQRWLALQHPVVIIYYN